MKNDNHILKTSNLHRKKENNNTTHQINVKKNTKYIALKLHKLQYNYKLEVMNYDSCILDPMATLIAIRAPMNP